MCMPASCSPKWKRRKSWGRGILHIERALHSSNTRSLASGQRCRPDSTWLWEDRSVTAAGQISCCWPWVKMRGHMPSCSPGRQCPRAPLQGGRGAALSVPFHPPFFASPPVPSRPWAARFALHAAFPGWATREYSFIFWRLQYKHTPRATTCWRAGFFQGKVSSILTNYCGLIQAYPLIQGFHVLCFECLSRSLGENFVWF